MQTMRIAITGIGVASGLGNSLNELRMGVLAGRSGVSAMDVPWFGATPAGQCDIDLSEFMSPRNQRRGTRAGAISCWCARAAASHAGIEGLAGNDRVGLYIGIAEHGSVQTESQLTEIAEGRATLKQWSHHNAHRTVASNPSGEASLNMGITGPAYTLGGACAAGTLGLIHAAQMLQLGVVDLAIAGGVSESIRTYGAFANFRAIGALAQHENPECASRPFDLNRTGVVISEGGCLFALEREETARARGARIHGLICGTCVRSDAHDQVAPSAAGIARCMQGALSDAGLHASQIDLLNTHATGTVIGDQVECEAIRQVFGAFGPPHINNTKSHLGHTMGAAGAIELAANIGSFSDGLVHSTINADHLDPTCFLPTLVVGEARHDDGVVSIMKNSCGMYGINAAIIVQKASN